MKRLVSACNPLSMLQRLREWFTLGLVALLPFHAFAVTVLTRAVAGPGHAPLAAIAVWKDVLLLVILVLAVIEMLPRLRSSLRLDRLDLLVLLLCLAALAVTLVHRPEKAVLLLAIKYDLVPPVMFVLLRRVPWSPWFRARLRHVLVSVGALVAALGLLTILLPTGAFTWLGYSDLHSLYVPGGPLAPYQQIGNSWLRRIQSTMSGPNQLGLWLLLPLGFLLPSLLRRTWNRSTLLATVLLGLCLALTFSRAAWIGAVVMAVLCLVRAFSLRKYRRFFVWGGTALLTIALLLTVLFPQVLFRLSSTRGHLEKPLQAMQRIWDAPFGLGLGEAGPASNRYRDACVFLRPQDDPAWAKAQPSLCVFLGTTQVQPVDRVCHCPFLTENWYLQLGVELGVAGLLLSLLLTFALIAALRVRWKQGADPLADAAFLAFLGVSIGALFLHAWEDAAVATTGWLLVAVALPFPPIPPVRTAVHPGGRSG